MSQGSIVLPTSGPATAATMFGDANAALLAVQSHNSGSTAPANGPAAAPVTNQVWMDTTANPVVAKWYDGASWVVFGKLDTAAHTWTPSYHGTDLGTAAIATMGTSGHVVPFLDGANTWSGVQSFNSGDIKLNGSASGAGTLNAPAAASAYVWTLPAATETLVGRATTDIFSNKSIDASANTLSNLTTSMFAPSVIDTDGTFAANSDTRVASQRASKTYMDQIIASADAMVFKGVVDCSASPNYPAADRGWTYKVSVAGKIGGSSGIVVDVGDTLMCLTDGTASGNQATVGSAWNIVQANLVGAVTGPASSTSGNIATFNGTGGTVIQDGGKALPAGTIVGTSDTQTLTNKSLTSPVVAGGTADALTSLGIRSTGAGFDVKFASSEALSANHTLSWTLGNADRGISLGGNLSFAGAYTMSGAFTFTGTLTGNTALTFPTAGTVATLGGAETLTNKTLTSPALGGIPTTPTASPSNNSTQVASTAYVDAQVAGSVAGVASLNGKSGALVNYYQPQGRLTLQTGVPVMTATQSAKTTVFYTPYQGNMVPIYDGTNMVPTAVPEISVATTDTSKNPSAIGASKVNDWFVWNDSGTVRLSHGPDWTNDTTRSAGTALVMTNGILLNNAGITNGPAASRGTYVGTTRSNASSQIDYIFGGAASGGAAAFLGVWNAYNRVSVGTTVSDTNNSYAYSSATIRQAGASAGNQISFVVGLQEDAVQLSGNCGFRILAVSGAEVQSGFGLDTTSGFSLGPQFFSSNGTILMQIGFGLAGVWNVGIGFHFISKNEASDGSNNNTFNNYAGVTGTQHADFIAAQLRM